MARARSSGTVRAVSGMVPAKGKRANSPGRGGLVERRGLEEVGFFLVLEVCGKVFVVSLYDIFENESNIEQPSTVFFPLPSSLENNPTSSEGRLDRIQVDDQPQLTLRFAAVFVFVVCEDKGCAGPRHQHMAFLLQQKYTDGVISPTLI